MHLKRAMKYFFEHACVQKTKRNCFIGVIQIGIMMMMKITSVKYT